jgi:hypothetical protein
VVSTPAPAVSALVRRVVTSAVATATIPISQGSRRNARQAISVDRMRARARAEAQRELERFHTMRESLPAVVLQSVPRVNHGSLNR